MKFNASIKQAEHFAETGEVRLVILKKEGDIMLLSSKGKPIAITKTDSIISFPVYGSFQEISGAKIQVGKSYVLCSKGKALWWCPDCKKVYSDEKLDEARYLSATVCLRCIFCRSDNYNVKPFRFKVESIKEKRVKKITDGELEAFGFDLFETGEESRERLAKGFKVKYSWNWNPESFVIKGKVI